MNKKCFAGFLQCKNRGTLPPKSSFPVFRTSIGDHVQCNLAHLTLQNQQTGRIKRREEKATRTYDACKREPAQEQVRALLVLPNLAKGDRARSVPPLFGRRIAIRPGISACASKQNAIAHLKTRQYAQTNRAFRMSRLERKCKHIRCLDGPARGAPPPPPPSPSSSSSSSPPPPPPPRRPGRRGGGSYPPVDLRAVCAWDTLTRFGAGGVESGCSTAAADDCLRFCFL